jgi:2-haloalkanoic acid dehalogenase type II
MTECYSTFSAGFSTRSRPTTRSPAAHRWAVAGGASTAAFLIRQVTIGRMTTLSPRRPSESVFSPDRASALVARLGELRPWPEAPAVLAQLRPTVKIGVVTNCSDEVGRLAAAQVGVPFDVVVTAEVADAYKPRPEPYRLALEALDVNAARALFVAGSPDDIAGANRVGMPVYWHNRRGVDLGGRARPLVEHDSLAPLLDTLIAS